MSDEELAQAILDALSNAAIGFVGDYLEDGDPVAVTIHGTLDMVAAARELRERLNI